MISPPSTQDGRNLDRRLADERGEGATFRIGEPDAAWPVPPGVEPSMQVPSDTYYDLPVVKAAPWRWFISTYFYLGGVAGAAATLAAGAELAREMRLARRLHGIASAGEALGAACLIADLGRPVRFHYMMRVFRPTSPMNVGTWILSAASASGGLALLGSLRGRRGRRGRRGLRGLRGLRGRRGITLASATSALTGSMLATYTAVLIGNTAIPIWDATRRRLPLWFAATSSASLASLLELFGWAPRRHRAYSLAAKTGELVAAHAVERAAVAAGVARPFREGRSGRLWRGAKWLSLASLAATVFDRPRLAGALGTAAAVLARFAIVDAGRASAADPRATFAPQRRAAGELR